jgi:hypothetical protein
MLSATEALSRPVAMDRLGPLWARQSIWQSMSLHVGTLRWASVDGRRSRKVRRYWVFQHVRAYENVTIVKSEKPGVASSILALGTFKKPPSRKGSGVSSIGVFQRGADRRAV